MPRKNKKKKHILIYIILIIALIISILLLAASTYRSYSAWQQRHNYFSQQNITIQSWMTLKEINHNFNLTYNQIYSAIGNTSSINNHISLNRYCIVYNKNCNQILMELNNLIK
ncbi:MAG: hypothetical protein ABSG05_01220 [Candidatus Pacearchaeota archaeon]|jgi:flagellar basal body-associated protein FliL